jgi:hypothetical protein
MLSVSDFVSFSVEQPGQALAEYNVNALALLTKDAPIQNYGVGAVATASIAGGAVSGFTVNPGGAGYLTPPPVFIVGGGGTGAVGVATVNNGVVTGINLVFGGTGYTSPPTVVFGNGFRLYVDPIQVGLDFGTNSETFALATEIFGQSPNILSGGGYLIIYAMAAGDTLSTAITALAGTLYCGGFIFGGYQPNQAEILAAAALIQALSPRRLLFAPTSSLSDLYPAGTCYQIQQLEQTQTRNLIHTASAQQARLFAAAYASRLMSVDFEGTDTTITMNLKNLEGIPIDTGISETIAAQCQTVGADYYAGVGSTLAEAVSTGGNDYSDNVFNLTWLLGALQVEVFNVLGTTPTKIPQTEGGMDTITSAIVTILQQAVANGFLAPGQWNGATFGDPASFVRNIADFGFYVYHIPVAQQSQTLRSERIAPTIQIAVKYAGAIQKVIGIIFPQD